MEANGTHIDTCDCYFEYKSEEIHGLLELEQTYVIVHRDTEIVCHNCGFEYPAHYTEQYSKEEPQFRICFDCKEGLTE